MYRILFASSEAYPLIKTGGLGDVAGALPPALKSLHCDIRLIMPAYQDARARAESLRHMLDFYIPESAVTVSVLETLLPGTKVKCWLVDYAPAYERPGNPYLGPEGAPWSDNAARFTLFSRVITAIAAGTTQLDWEPDVLHCNDWQTGLVPALLSPQLQRPVTVFTIHNLAYQGLFPYDTFVELGLPDELWSPEHLEFHGQLSFIKGGLVFADALTTVSPNYAQEIQTPAHGCGLDGLLRHRADRLIGILNGIDERIWNPARDSQLVRPFSARRIANKRENKLALQQETSLFPSPDIPVIGFVGRAVEQKGIDLIVDALPQLLQLPLQLVLLTSGGREYERELRQFSEQQPARLAVYTRYDEPLAHRIYGSADMLLVPSRFEPCGLTQLYSLRYGTVPIVHHVGGLADTVVDANDTTIAAGTATGVVFDEPTLDAMIAAVERALVLHRKPQIWKKIALTGMRQSFSWRTSAARYVELYQQLVRSPL